MAHSTTQTVSEEHQEQNQEEMPSWWSWALQVGAAVGLTGMFCCMAPMVLFMFGLAGGIWAISFADFFYYPDGSATLLLWGMRGLAALVGVAGFLLYRKKQNQCSIDPKRKRLNLILTGALIVVLGLGFYFTFEELSAWYFDAYIVPAQQLEYQMMAN